MHTGWLRVAGSGFPPSPNILRDWAPQGAQSLKILGVGGGPEPATLSQPVCTRGPYYMAVYHLIAIGSSPAS